MLPPRHRGSSPLEFLDVIMPTSFVWKKPYMPAKLANRSNSRRLQETSEVGVIMPQAGYCVVVGLEYVVPQLLRKKL